MLKNKLVQWLCLKAMIKTGYNSKVRTEILLLILILVAIAAVLTFKAVKQLTFFTESASNNFTKDPTATKTSN